MEAACHRLAASEPHGMPLPAFVSLPLYRQHAISRSPGYSVLSETNVAVKQIVKYVLGGCMQAEQEAVQAAVPEGSCLK